ncbi:DNA repair protein RecN [Panacibacter sp. DH6]|uniref:DNA repair protein RecN n=1 Tax=Panacibacter microcysteis TaxID=2793269 RepID=A0A931MCV6_9BACT|nr:DNA repair protein RecN [Panacibacter microcysteis]MBG9378290.1 DNA repair protein RecN [Panacibacter microcysteis]
MLQKLHIQNYAIIDEIEIDFSKQLNIITGETGAGKSILMGALNLILGERADTSMLMKTDKKCFIEGFFVVEKKKPVKAFLASQEFDVDDELVLRREIAANGKSRAFINDSPATLQQLKQLASLLVDLHQQFDTLELGDADFQREVLDALAGNNAMLAEYRLLYYQWQSAKKELEQLQLQKSNFNKELDYFQFLFDELNDLGLKPNELEDLDAELQVLSNAEAIKNALGKVYFELKETEQPVLQVIKQLVNQLQSYETYDSAIATLIERLRSTQIELADIASEAEHTDSKIVYDEQRIDKVNERIAAGYKMLKKHNVKTTDELLQVQQSLEERLQTVLNIDQEIINKEKNTARLLKDAEAVATNISAARKAETEPLCKKVNALLTQVGMPNARLKIDVADAALNEFGKNSIEFLFDANKSNRFEPLRKVASGGELSRLMLCIKSLVAESIDLPTMIFDEIDTGISGEAAKQVGIIMKKLAGKRQVIAITHQPQIAGKADAHFFVYKEIKGDAIKTNIRLLNQDERITAIAQMLSGEKPTAAALENAREMIMN